MWWTIEYIRYSLFLFTDSYYSFRMNYLLPEDLSLKAPILFISWPGKTQLLCERKDHCITDIQFDWFGFYQISKAAANFP